MARVLTDWALDATLGPRLVDVEALEPEAAGWRRARRKTVDGRN
jgi:hypothetical protein